MSNPLFNQLNQQTITNNVLPIKQMFNNLKTASNPQAMLSNMMGSNPQMKQAMDMIRQYGGDPKTAFMNEAKKRGINPQEILNMLK